MRSFAEAALVGSLVAAGCNAQAADMRHIAPGDDELAQSGMTDQGQWQSAPWNDSTWISLHGRAAIEIEHELGYEPALVQVYLSSGEGDCDDGGRNAFPGAGDVAHISNVTDASVTIENTSAGDFCLRVVLH